MLLRRYIFFQFFRHLALLLTSFVCLYLLIDFFQKIDNFIEKGKSAGLILKFFLLSIPFILEQMHPISILLAGVVTLGLLNHSNELIALKSCGVSLRLIITPILLAACASTLFFLALSQWLLPQTVSLTNQIWNKDVRGQIVQGIYRNGRYYYRGQDGFYSFGRPDPQAYVFTDFSFSAWNQSYESTRIIAAKLGKWGEHGWLLEQGQSQQALGPESFAAEMFKSKQLDFADAPEQFFIPSYRSMELSLFDLYRETKRKNSPEETNRAWTDLYRRLSYALLGLPLLLLGLPLVLMVYRTWGRDLSLAIPVSCGLAFVCWGVWIILFSFARVQYIPPLAAAITVHCVVGLSGLLLLIREDS